jgi:hypothetical protein
VVQAARPMRRRLLAPGLFALLVIGCSLVSSNAPDRSAARVRPTCSDIELEPCMAESITVTAKDLGIADSYFRSADRRSTPVRCVLRETGVVESCHVLEPRDASIDTAVENFLEQRLYDPVSYGSRKVIIPYTFLVSFAPPPGEASAISSVRLEVFRALLTRLSSSVADAGSSRAAPLVCVGVGEDVADPPRAEMEALIRGGAHLEPASACWGLLQATGGAALFGSVVVREVHFDRPDVATVRAEVGLSGQSPEVVQLRASRLGTRWLLEERSRTPIGD